MFLGPLWIKYVPKGLPSSRLLTSGQSQIILVFGRFILATSGEEGEGGDGGNERGDKDDSEDDNETESGDFDEVSIKETICVIL